MRIRQRLHLLAAHAMATCAESELVRHGHVGHRVLAVVGGLQRHGYLIPVPHFHGGLLVACHAVADALIVSLSFIFSLFVVGCAMCASDSTFICSPHMRWQRALSQNWCDMNMLGTAYWPWLAAYSATVI